MAPAPLCIPPPPSKFLVHEDSEPLKRDWRVFAAQDADGGRDVDEMDATDLGACRAHCERYGLGGFVVHEGMAYFRWDAAEGLERRRQPAAGCELHLGFAWQERQTLAAPLRDEDGMPAVVGESVGLWLDPLDFIVATEEGHNVGLGTAVNLGVHGLPRGWPQVFNESSVLKNLLKKSGPCAATRVSKVPRPTKEQRHQVDGVPLWPLQSFENALAVQAHTGMDVVKGWAVYDLYSWEPGSVYVAEAYWWNAAAGGQWLDFTPHPANSPELLLAETADPASRPDAVLALEQLVLAEGLACLRFPGAAAARGVELGSEDAVSLALRHAQLDDSGAIRRSMVEAGMCGALVEHLSVQRSLPAAVQLLALLAGCLREKAVGEEAWAPLHSTDVVWALVRVLSGPYEAALAAASALAHLCHGSADVRKLALHAGAAQALADLFGKSGAGGAAGHGAREAALALWEQLEERPEDQAASPGEPAEALAAEWQVLLEDCRGQLQRRHAEEEPMERRGRSWARTLAFAKVALGAQGAGIRRGTAEQPFVIWVLGAEDMVEAYLAEEGFFSDANWVDRAPTEVVIVGEQLRELSPGRLPPRTGQPAAVRTANCEALRWLLRLGAPSPDLVAVLTPEAHSEGVSLPQQALALAARAPAVISTRCPVSESGLMDLRCKTKAQLLLRPTRCPFSSLVAGSSKAAYEDNAWILAVRGLQALDRALGALAVEASRRAATTVEQRTPGTKAPCVFWGILDIKYDTSRPLLERVKVLETGDGATSKFSNHGAKVKSRFDEGYTVEPGAMDLHMYKLISGDKKWTHDRMENVGYEHIVPKQACYPRKYQADLADRIKDDLGIRAGELVVLKLCNRSRAAGVVVTPVDELDEVLEDLLVPPKDLETWFEEGLQRTGASPTDLGIGGHSFAEQQRHWWSNESPVFVAERWCGSTPVVVEDGSAVDATLRVGFVIRRQRHQVQGAASQDDLLVEWLGGYWKLSKSEGSLRARLISAARTVGTADVGEPILQDVYTALGDAVQGLFSETEPTTADLTERYQEMPELAAFFIAKLGWTKRKDLSIAKQMLTEAEAVAMKAGKDMVRASVQSFIVRAQGLLQSAPHPAAERYLREERLFEKSLLLLPTNANSFMFLGVAALQGHRYKDAVENLFCSLLLDPDYKAPYCNLGAAFINLGRFREAKEISEAGLSRHPDSPACDYHIGVACCQLALQLRSGVKGGLSFSDSARYEELRREALSCLLKAREHEDAKRRRRSGETPWLEADERMLAAMQEGAAPAEVKLPAGAGWQYVSTRV